MPLDIPVSDLRRTVRTKVVPTMASRFSSQNGNRRCNARPCPRGCGRARASRKGKNRHVLSGVRIRSVSGCRRARVSSFRESMDPFGITFGNVPSPLTQATFAKMVEQPVLTRQLIGAAGTACEPVQRGSEGSPGTQNTPKTSVH
jgi:hypothetical protein